MLRPYQSQCLTAIGQAWRERIEGQLINLPVGSGKTVIAGNIPRRLPPGSKHLFLVQANELVWQAREKFAALNPDLKVGIEKAEHKADLAQHDIIIASVQSISRKSRLARFEPGRFASIGCDEFHHATAESYLETFRHFRCLKNEPDFDPSILFYGVTATPERSDNIGLEKVASKIVFHRSILDLMKEGPQILGKKYAYLADVKCFRVDSYAELDDVHVRHGELADDELADAVDTPERNRIIAESYLKYGENLAAFAWTVNIRHSVNLAEVFRKMGIPAEVMTGATPAAERERIFAALDSGELKMVASTGVLGEGIDRPMVGCGLMARPHKAALPYRQKFGRIIRPFPSPEDYLEILRSGSAPKWIKPHAVLIDFVDLTSRHSLISAPSLFGLRSDFRMDGESALETLDEVEKIERQTSLDLRDKKSLREMKAAAEEVDLFRPPETTGEIRRWSKLSWLRTGQGRYCLVLLNNRSVRITETQLGQWEISTHEYGMKQVRSVATNLARAISTAEDRYVPREEMVLLRENAAWHMHAPTEQQCASVFRHDPRIRNTHRTAGDFYAFALAEHAKGNLNYSKGGISRIISSQIAARPAWIQQRIGSRTKTA